MIQIKKREQKIWKKHQSDLLKITYVLAAVNKFWEARDDLLSISGSKKMSTIIWNSKTVVMLTLLFDVCTVVVWDCVLLKEKLDEEVIWALETVLTTRVDV